MHVAQAIFYHSTRDTSERFSLDTAAEKLLVKTQRYKGQKLQEEQMGDVCPQTIQVMDHGTPSWVDQVLLQLGHIAVCS